MPQAVLDHDSGTTRLPVVRTSHRRRYVLLLIAVLTPAIFAFGILYHQRLPVPYQDDYRSILDFALHYQQLSDAGAKLLDIAVYQHNEYKLSFEHAIVASEVELTQQLNFAFLTGLGDLLLLPIAYLFWRIYKPDEIDTNRRLLEFLPVSFVFFSLSYWETLNWAMAELQNIAVFLFSLLAVYLLVSRPLSGTARGRFCLACLAAALAACSSANGFLLAPKGLLILLPRRAYARSLTWCASFALPLAAYLYHYVSSAHAVSKVAFATRPVFFLGFLGGVVPFRWLAALTGMVILVILLLAIHARFDRSNPVIFYFAMWVVATACLVSWVRGAAGFMVSSRYSMYSSFLVIFCYVFLTDYLSSRSSSFKIRRFHLTCLVLAVAFCFVVDFSANKSLGTRRHMVLSGMSLPRQSAVQLAYD